MKKRNKSILLILIIFLPFFVSWSFAEDKKYPPYPDVWGYHFQWPGAGNKYAPIDVAKMPDGDFMVTYIKNWDEKVNKYGGTLYFSGEKREFTIDSYDQFWRTHLNDRAGEKRIILASGDTIEQTSIATSAQCPDPFYDYYLTKKDRSGSILARKMLLYLCDKPQKLKVNRYCERNNSYKKEYVLKTVQNIYAKLILLKDETFLAYDTNGNFILRLNSEFSTKSSLVNSKIFIIERASYEEMYRKQSEKGEINDQEINDVMANYLIGLRKEGAK